MSIFLSHFTCSFGKSGALNELGKVTAVASFAGERRGTNMYEVIRLQKVSPCFESHILTFLEKVFYFYRSQ